MGVLRTSSWGHTCSTHPLTRAWSGWPSLISRVQVKFSQSCLTLCDPMDCSLLGFSVHGILQTRMEWIAIPFSRGSSQPRHRTLVSHIAGGFFTIGATRGYRVKRVAGNSLNRKKMIKEEILAYQEERLQ